MTDGNFENSNVRPTNESDPDLWIYLNQLTDLRLSGAPVVKDERNHFVTQRQYVAFGARVLLQREVEAKDPDRGRHTVLQATHIRDAGESVERYEYFEYEDFLATSKGKTPTDSVVVGMAIPEERIEAFLRGEPERSEDFDAD